VSDSSRHINTDDRLRHRRLVHRLAISGAAVLTLVLIGVSAAVIGEAGRHPTRPVADPQPAFSATVAATEESLASPSPTASPGPATSAVPSPAGTPTKPARTTAKPPSGNTSYESQVVTLVNQERAKAGCGALTVDSRLTTAARGHSQDMATRNYFDHNTPEGVDPFTRMTKAGYHWRGAGENIAEGQSNPASVMTAWMNSAGHRANILNCSFKNIGVGLAYNSRHTPYWTQDFGRPA
jgi:uncharacterized YkwD family protein